MRASSQKELREELKNLRKENDYLREAAEYGKQCYQDRCENAYVEYTVVKGIEKERDRLHERADALREAIRICMNNLGVPQSGYPAPIAYAYECCKEAMARDEEMAKLRNTKYV